MLARAHSGLRIESVALVCQVLTIDKDFLTSKIATLPASIMARIDAGLRLTLALGSLNARTATCAAMRRRASVVVAGA